MSIVEFDEIVVILSFPSLSQSEVHGEFFTKDQYPELTEMENLDEIGKFLRLGEIIGYRPFPLQYDRIEDIREDAAEGRDERNFKAIALVEEAAKEWAVELADIHMARADPDLEDAKLRMTGAYTKLFELERRLRTFVSTSMEAQHGSDWWDSDDITEGIRRRVSERQADRSGFWLDQTDEAILRFVDFADLRPIIIRNRGAFANVLGPKERPTNWFVSTLSALEPLRNRIGHVNTLSADNYADFMRDANRILAAIHPSN